MPVIKNFKDSRGQSLVETALITPLIILLLAGIIDFGLLFNNYLIISNASREGARLAAVGMDDSGIVTRIYNLTSSLDSSRLTVSVTPAESYRKRGNEVIVSITYNNELITPIISSILPNPIKIKASTTMRIE